LTILTFTPTIGTEPGLYKALPDMRRSGILRQKLQETKFYPCANVAAVSECGQGHTYAKVIPCGREWCEYCGENYSVIHGRRIDRWMPKINQMNKLGYMVVTLPDAAAKMMEREDLAAFGRALIRYLKRDMKIQRGLFRWHWCGDCRKCKGKGCKDCEYKGTGKKFHPHINLIFERGYMDKNDLECIKQFVCKWVKNNIKYEYENAVIHYQFTKDKNKMKHIVNYVTRSTMRFAGLTVPGKNGQYLKNFIKGFRTTNTWGKWDKVEKPQDAGDTPTALLNNKVCECCANNTGEFSPLKFLSKPVPIKDIYQTNITRYKDGWYYLAGKLERPPELDEPDDLKLFRLKERALVDYRATKQKQSAAFLLILQNKAAENEATNGQKQTDLFGKWQLSNGNKNDARSSTCKRRGRPSRKNTLSS